MDEDFFDKPYKIVIKKFRGSPIISRIELDILRNVINESFPERLKPIVMLTKGSKYVPLLGIERIVLRLGMTPS